jgi:hypothetical protein
MLLILTPTGEWCGWLGSDGLWNELDGATLDACDDDALTEALRYVESSNDLHAFGW